jgi:hypothetical protein
MSRKNRAFALAVATAALVGLSAPVASAASFDGPSGFNNDSILNLSGNQLPVQTCTSGAPVNTVTETQTVASALADILPTLGTGAVSPMQGNTCTQTTSETNTATADTAPATAASEHAESRHHHHHMRGSEEADPSSDPGNVSGFNNDSVLDLSGNQLPVQTCTSGAALNTVTETQALTGVLSILPALTTGAVSPMQGNTCTQTTTEDNTATTNS